MTWAKSNPGPGERDVLIDLSVALLQGCAERTLRMADMITFVFWWEDYDCKDTAAAMGKTVEWVKQSRHRLREYLASSMEGYFEGNFESLV